MTFVSLSQERDNKRRNDCLFSFDDLDSSQFLTIFVDEYQQEQEDLDDEFASECEAIFGL